VEVVEELVEYVVKKRSLAAEHKIMFSPHLFLHLTGYVVLMPWSLPTKKNVDFWTIQR